MARYSIHACSLPRTDGKLRSQAESDATRFVCFAADLASAKHIAADQLRVGARQVFVFTDPKRGVGKLVLEETR